MLSLCLENAELKERMGEATSLLESGEQEEAGLGSPLAPEPRRLQRKSRSTLGDHPASGSGDSQGVPAERGAVPTKRPALEARSQDDMPKRPCPGTLGGGDGSHVSALGAGKRDGGGNGELTACLSSLAVGGLAGAGHRAVLPGGTGTKAVPGAAGQACCLRGHSAGASRAAGEVLCHAP